MKNLTQKEVAQKLHVTDKAVSKWERGINFPDLGLMEELAVVLDSTPSILLGLEDATKEEIVTSFAEISSQQTEDAEKEIQQVGWITLFARAGFDSKDLCAGISFTVGKLCRRTFR